MYRSETFCVEFVTLFCCSFFCSQCQKFRSTWINSRFKTGWFLLQIFIFFVFFCQNHRHQGYQVFLMAYYCRFAIKIVPKMPHCLIWKPPFWWQILSVWKYCSSSKQLTRNWWPWHLKSNKDKSEEIWTSFSCT